MPLPFAPARLRLSFVESVTVRAGIWIKHVLFVVTTLSIALAIVLGAGGCHYRHSGRLGPPVVRAEGQKVAALPPSPLEGGRDKGAPALAVQSRVPPAAGIEPSPADRPIDPPYRHDGARIDHSLSSGAPGSDPRTGGR